jgi:predicted membrane-bound spermidine synthase
MGATSPLIISILTEKVSESGENSGKIYAVSTVGGILATFLCGFYLIPTLGITLTLLCFAVLLALVSLFLVFKKKSKAIGLSILIPILLSVYGFINIKTNPYSIYKTEGILGQLEIRDEPNESNASVVIRKLLINNIIQTEMNMETKQSVSEYIRLLQKNLLYFPKGKALILGLGGGLVSNILAENHYQVTGVEFDERIINMAKQFFYLDDDVKTVCDDARHFINSDKGKYNLVLFDIFKAEEQPSHVITKESLETLKTLLDTNAVVLINTHGYLKDEKGLGTQCLLATFKQAGFQLKICTPSENEDYRNLLIVASLKPLQSALHNELYPIIISNTDVINTDNQPVLEKLNAKANQSWRSNYIKNYILFN